MKRRNKGITLVALIITIIAMLILVAVSVQIVINSGIFESAKEAAKKTEEAYRAEGADGGKININGKVYNSIEEYMKLPGTNEWQDGEIKKTDIITKYSPPINATNTELFGREVNYSVPSQELINKIGSYYNKWLVLYQGNSFSENGETETYLIMKDAIYSASSPNAVDMDGNPTEYKTTIYNGGTSWGNVLTPYADVPLNERNSFYKNE